MRPLHPVCGGTTAPVRGEARSHPGDLRWLHANAPRFCLLAVAAASSSPLSDAQDEPELKLVSMETTDSESWGNRGEEGLEHAGESEAEEEEEAGEEALLGSAGSGGLWWPCSMLCSGLLLLNMLFMAFCISSSILCFSLFGMRPNRTAERKKKKRKGH